jgi:cobalt-zinc-cadmium efflux system outer membrane protein
MKSLGRMSLSVCLAMLIVSLAGCGATRPSSLLQASREHLVDTLPGSAECSHVVQATLLGPVDPATVRAVQEDQRPAIDQELSVEVLVAEVLTRNPNLTQMVAAWQAASAKYPQVRSLDDPMVGGTFAPASFNSNSVAPGYSIEVLQKIPFPGKLRLRGQGALAEASAAQNDVEDMRVQLIEAAKLAFYDYYLVDRALSVNDEGLKLLKEFRESADSRFKTGLVPQQDILQADVEIGKQRERGVTLDRMRKVAVARINTLRNLDPNEPIPPPPAKLDAVSGLPPVARLRQYALAQRPDLKALHDRIAAEETALALAFREYYPDVEVFGGYNTIMGNGPMRDLAPQVGVRMNLPIRTARRNGAVEEARAKILQKRAELDSRVSQLNFQVQEAYEQLLESERILVLYDKTILPAAKANVQAAQSAYTTGKTPFLSLIEAQRNLVNLRDRHYEATADYFRRLATLERVIGGPLPTSAQALPQIQKK